MKRIIRTLNIGSKSATDATYPSCFCPVCGGTDVQSIGDWEPLPPHRKYQKINCRVCKWETVVYPTKLGKNKFVVRQDNKYNMPQFFYKAFGFPVDKWFGCPDCGGMMDEGKVKIAITRPWKRTFRVDGTTCKRCGEGLISPKGMRYIDDEVKEMWKEAKRKRDDIIKHGG